MTAVALRDGRTQVAAGVLATAVLTGLSALALGGTPPSASATVCSAPALPGTVVTVTASDLGGGSMMGSGTMPGSMRLTLDRSTVPAGVVSIVVVDVGRLRHELVVLPLQADRSVGNRPVGADGTVEERGSSAEASSSCSEGSGTGIEPGTTGWVTTTLATGRYELVCNRPGHYAAGMRSLLTVSYDGAGAGG